LSARRWTALATALVALATAPPATGGEEFPVALKVAKKKDGPYHPSLNAISLAEGQTKSFWFRAKNKTDERLKDLILDDGPFPIDDDLSVRWFQGDDNVSPQVQGGGLEFNLKPRKAKRFRMRVKATGPAEDCLTGQVEVPSVDTVAATVGINVSCIM
jgi:hypothetical protein